MEKENFLLPNGEFDWEKFESSIPSRKHNPKVKLIPGDKSKVFCREPYAQELYEIYTGSSQIRNDVKLGSIVQGKIISVNESHAIVDVNWRENVVIDLKKENKEFIEHIKPDLPIEVLIDNKNKNIVASYSKNLLARKKDEILNSIGKQIAYPAKVIELIRGGYFVDIYGVKCFMPGSLGGMNKLVNFEELVGKQIYVVPINYSKEKNYIVVSHREYLKTLIPEEISKLEFNKQYTGFVTGCSRHGIFVEFNGCLTGLISRNDISPEKLSDFDNQLIRPGDTISFYVKEIINNEKIVLSQKPVQEALEWDGIDEKYKVGSTVTGKIKKIVKYGVFIELEPKIVGLLHKSYLSEDTILEAGQEIDVKIARIDKESKKIDFEM